MSCVLITCEGEGVANERTLREKAPEPGIRRGRALSMPTRERSAIAATGRRDLEGGGGAEKEACKRLARVRRRRGEVVCLLYITTTRRAPVSDPISISS